MNCFNRKILKINLNDKTFKYIIPPLRVYHEFLGGRGLAGFFLKKSFHLKWNHPESALMIFSGTISVPLPPFSPRILIMGKSPLTEGIACTSLPGHFSSSLNNIEIDGIIITGKCRQLSEIQIRKNKVLFKSLTKSSSFKFENNKPKKTLSFISVKEAALKNISYSNVQADGQYSGGRGGIGLIFGNKNIKCISIEKTSKHIIPHSKTIKKSLTNVIRLLDANPVLMGMQGFNNSGTLSLLNIANSKKMLPLNNFKKSFLSKKEYPYSSLLKLMHYAKSFTCPYCPVKCLKHPPAYFINYDHLVSFAALTKDFNIEFACKAMSICQDQGLDPVSTSGTIAAFNEITKLKPTKENIFNTLSQILNGKGTGEELKKGGFTFSKNHGESQASMSVKKLELSPFDPRSAYGLALSYITSARGGTYHDAFSISHEILRKPVSTDRFALSGKARIIKRNEDEGLLYDSLGICRFLSLAVPLDEIAILISEIAGKSFSSFDLKRIGARVYYQERMLNASAGFSAKDDDLPMRFFNAPEPGTFQPQIPPIPRKKFLDERKKYYKIRELDKHGAPIKESALKFNLKWYG